MCVTVIFDYLKVCVSLLSRDKDYRTNLYHACPMGPLLKQRESRYTYRIFQVISNLITINKVCVSHLSRHKHWSRSCVQWDPYLKQRECTYRIFQVISNLITINMRWIFFCMNTR